MISFQTGYALLCITNSRSNDDHLSLKAFHPVFYPVQMEGFEDFEGRRKRKFDKQIDSNVMINSKGLDEGVDL